MVEEKKIKDKTQSSSKLARVIISLIISFLVMLLFLSISSSSCGSDSSTETVAKSLLQSLQSSAAIYVAQQKVQPGTFSDYIVSSGPAGDQHTLILENLTWGDRPQVNKVVGIETTKMKLTFVSGFEATYYLSGTEVTGLFIDSNEIKTIPNIVIYKIIMSCVLFILSFLLFYFLSGLINLIRFIFYIVIIFILAIVSVPKFTKPAIYLYPEVPTEVNIKLDKTIKVGIDIPTYHPQKGWNVLARPDGQITDLQPKFTDCDKLESKVFGLEYAKKACEENNYPYVYWDGQQPSKPLPEKTEGWVVSKSELSTFFESKLSYAGLNTAEKNEFLAYWVPKISALKEDSVFIYFLQTEELNNYLPMTVTPEPDSVNRLYIVVVKNADRYKESKPQELEKFTREGFTLVEWGGTVVP